jgi:acetyl-CoA carboxylase biotin carboxyl carrier protein
MSDERDPEPGIDPGIPAAAAEPGAGGTPGAADADGSLLAILDRLTGLLERSDLTEIEVEAGGTGLVLRKAAALTATAAPVALAGSAVPSGLSGADGAAPASEAPGRPSVKAPLTGIFYGAPGPGSAPYVQVGGEVAVGQVIGLIEAMKLFNEIKSDLAGRVVRVVPESGALVKAKQPLIEVEPL